MECNFVLGQLANEEKEYYDVRNKSTKKAKYYRF